MSDKNAAETHWKLLMDRDFIGAADLRGQDRTVTIKTVQAGDLPIEGSKKTQRKPVLEFEETTKKMAVNSTNGRTIAELYGPLTVAWPGQRITLYPTTAKFKGKEVEAVRIRPTVPAPKQARSGRAAPPPGVPGSQKPDLEREAAALRAHLENEDGPAAGAPDPQQAEPTPAGSEGAGS